jgi:hypothetical protein
MFFPRGGRIMKRIPFLLLCATFILPNSVSLAQEPLAQLPQAQQRPQDGGTRELLISIFIPSMPNAAFTATVNTEWIRQLSDGSSITWRNHRTIARDAAGRIFQERRTFVPEGRQGESVVTEIDISDPVAHELYVCRTSERVCRLESFSAPAATAHLAQFNVPTAGNASPGAENLGKQIIGGLETLGMRETTVLPAGSLGNNSPILTKREFWYSPQLGVNLISKLQDPRSGEQNFEVSDIAVGEPDAKLFEVPGGYKVLDLRKPPEIVSPQSASPN